MDRMRIALMATIKGEERYMGKVVGDTFYRNFPFKNAELWMDRELSFDQRVLEFLIKNKIKKIIFMDIENKKARKIGIRKFQNRCSVKDLGEGLQAYIHFASTDKVEYPQIPFISDVHYLDKDEMAPVFDNENNEVVFVKKASV